MANENHSSERIRFVNEVSVHVCDLCEKVATQSVFDNEEIPSTSPEGWREFKLTTQRFGCAWHPPVSMTKYLDGRTIPTLQCNPEKV